MISAFLVHNYLTKKEDLLAVYGYTRFYSSLLVPVKTEAIGKRVINKPGEVIIPW
jgi:hypothetical protein